LARFAPDDPLDYSAETACLAEWLPPGGVFFDVGACVGGVSAIALEMCPDAEVHAFEPNPLNAGELAAAGLPVRLNRVAVGGGPGTALLYSAVEQGPDLLASLRRRRLDRHGISSYEVGVEALDEYCQRERVQADVLKIDVEGGEFEVIEGAVEMLAHVRCVVFEHQSDWDFEDGYQPSLSDLLTRLEGLGFTIEFWDGAWRSFSQPPDSHYLMVRGVR
jgi:FkbM family methyltransferase